MKIQILGTGCPKCKKLTEIAQEAVAESGVDAEVLKIQALDEIMKFGVMITPALAVDGEVKCAGRLATKAEVISWIKK